LWLGLASVAGVSVLVVASTDGSKWIALLNFLADEFCNLGMLRTMFVLGIPPGVTVCDP